MARREKHRRAERAARGDVVIVDEAYGGTAKPPPRRRAIARQEPGSLGFLVLEGMQRKPHVYQGTVDPVTVAERRAANKRARKARRRQQRQARR